VIFDRSWYNRAGVEPSWACTQEESERFLALVPQFENAMVDSGFSFEVLAGGGPG
jgi:polyphosphate kinase 2 (PPK2 family)